MHFSRCLIATFALAAPVAPTTAQSTPPDVHWGDLQRLDEPRPEINQPDISRPEVISPPAPAIDNATFCTTHDPALANAIHNLCYRKDGLTIGNNIHIAGSDDEYKSSPHKAQVHIEGACASDDTGPPEDLSSDFCMAVMNDLCRARLDHGERGVVLDRGKRDCQHWFIPGWEEKYMSGYEWYGLKVLRMEDLSVDEVGLPSDKKKSGWSPGAAPGGLTASSTRAAPASLKVVALTLMLCSLLLLM